MKPQLTDQHQQLTAVTTLSLSSTKFPSMSSIMMSDMLLRRLVSNCTEPACCNCLQCHPQQPKHKLSNIANFLVTLNITMIHGKSCAIISTFVKIMYKICWSLFSVTKCSSMCNITKRRILHTVQLQTMTTAEHSCKQILQYSARCILH